MTNYYRGQRTTKRRKHKINKIRFSIFILTCIVILGGIFLGLKSILTPKVDVEFSMSEDLNPAASVSEFKLILNWDKLDGDKYKNIIIKVEDESFELNATDTSFVYVTNEPNKNYELEFIANKKGLGLSAKQKHKFKTSGDNSTIYQEVDNFVIDKDHLIFNHLIRKDNKNEIDLKSLVYDLTTPNDMTLERITPIVVEETNEYVLLEVAIPVSIIQDEYSVLLEMNYKINGVSYKNAVKDFDMETTVNYTQGAGGFTPHFQGQVLVLLNDSKDHYEYKQHYFYAESLQLDVNLSEEVSQYQLISQDEAIVDAPYFLEANKGIELKDLNPGLYLIYLNEKPIYTSETIYDVWYTIRRNGVAKQITVETYMGILSLKVDEVSQTPDNVYDIIIDPGHGGMDTGTAILGLEEATEVLKISKYIANRLEEHDLKVKLTREDEFDPAGEGKFDYTESPFYDEGRVEQAYRYSANYMMSNHLNSFDKSLTGFELYSSIISSNDWASSIASEFMALDREPRDSEKNEFRVSQGSYKRYYPCTNESNVTCKNPYVDYLYIIRETGGRLSQASTLLEYNDAYKEIPNYGAETILVEYAYIDNANDNKAWLNNWEKWGEAVVKATLTYLDIPYVAK